MTRLIPRLFATAAGCAFLLVPRRHRLPVAFRAGLLVSFALRIFRVRRGSALDGYREEGIRLAIHSMRRLRIPFDLHLRVEGPVPPRGPAIIACAHFLLTSLAARYLLDRDAPPVFVSGDPPPDAMYVGTNIAVDFIRVSRMTLVQIRSRLAQGKKVMMMIDEARPHEGWVRVETAAGARSFSDQLLRLAERLGTPLYFCAVHAAEDGVPTATFEAAPSRAADAVQAYTAFLTRHAAITQRA